MKFYPIDIKTADWKRLDGFADRTVFQTREWLQFVAESQNAQPYSPNCVSRATSSDTSPDSRSRSSA